MIRRFAEQAVFHFRKRAPAGFGIQLLNDVTGSRLKRHKGHYPMPHSRAPFRPRSARRWGLAAGRSRPELILWHGKRMGSDR